MNTDLNLTDEENIVSLFLEKNWVGKRIVLYRSGILRI